MKSKDSLEGNIKIKKEKQYLINSRVHEQKISTSRDQLPNQTP